MASFQEFMECLAQLQEDQSLYESELGTAELQGFKRFIVVSLSQPLNFIFT
jgi:hypothetical protein